jgi:hypothetical protein
MGSVVTHRKVTAWITASSGRNATKIRNRGLSAVLRMPGEPARNVPGIFTGTPTAPTPTGRSAIGGVPARVRGGRVSGSHRTAIRTYIPMSRPLTANRSG